MNHGVVPSKDNLASILPKVKLNFLNPLYFLVFSQMMTWIILYI